MRTKLVFGVLALAAASSAALASVAPAAGWQIGPVIKGKNYSVGMPLRPEATADGWSFDFPAGSRAAGHVHYVTFDPGSLAGKSRIVVRYRVDARPGTRFVPQEEPSLPGTVSLVVQRRGDTWSAKGRYDLYRWYAPANTVRTLAPGQHRMVVDLDDGEWVSVYGTPAADNPQAMREALAEAGRIGLVFGSASMRGHGVFATAPARFELLSFELE